MKKEHLLFEIGCEDLPAWVGDHFINRFMPIFLDELGKNRLVSREIMFFFTPRRLILLGKDIPVCTVEEEKEVTGPKYDVAFDSSGVPTPAAYGFAKAQGVSVSALKIKQTNEKRFVYISKKIPSISSIKIFSCIIPSMLRRLDIPRGMRWNESGEIFYRPVRWIFAIFGNERVPMEFGGVKSSQNTFGHRVLSPGRIRIYNWVDYFDKIEKAFVIPDEKIRYSFIIELIKKSLRENETFDSGIVENLSNLVEYPRVIRCKFPDLRYNLPEDILSVLVEKAKGIPIFCGKSIQKEFFVISDGNCSDTIGKNYENLLRTRILDAQFFYETDLSQSFYDFRNKLEKIVFHQRWGSLLDRVNRMKKISAIISDILGLGNDEKNILTRAAELSKYDMASEMVREFPDLQGIMGAIYAGVSGECQQVCKAISEHVRPRFSGDSLPESTFGVLLGIVDRIDYLCCFISAGVDVSGSEDPYGLRRVSVALFQLVYKSGYDFDYEDIIDKIFIVYQFSASELDVTKNRIKNFLLQRFESYLETEGFPKGLRGSVLSVERLNFLRARNKLDAIRSFIRETANVDTILIPVTRVANILKQAKEKNIDIPDFKRELLKEDGEVELIMVADKYLGVLKDLLEKKNFSEFLRMLEDLKTPIDRFFDKILVMCPEENLRGNRLALLKMFNDVFLKFADFSYIKEEDIKNVEKN